MLVYVYLGYSPKGTQLFPLIPSMYGLFTYIWCILLAHVGKYTSPTDATGNESVPCFFVNVFFSAICEI